ncbi:Hypothetical predicted protein [Podarcis lilfordi]|nr:Hypothetical predicted protein [Podarcis lilfordi]
MAGPLQMPPELVSPAEDDLLMPQVPSSGRKRLQRRRSRRGGQRRAEMILTLPHSGSSHLDQEFSDRRICFWSDNQAAVWLLFALSATALSTGPVSEQGSLDLDSVLAFLNTRKCLGCPGVESCWPNCFPLFRSM